ncbi:hypothetical protein ACWE42_20715 [Sutcliffiella cohnii]
MGFERKTAKIHLPPIESFVDVFENESDVEVFINVRGFKSVHKSGDNKIDVLNTAIGEFEELNGVNVELTCSNRF